MLRTAFFTIILSTVYSRSHAAEVWYDTSFQPVSQLVTAMTWLPDSETIVAATKSKRVSAWSTQTGDTLWTSDLLPEFINDIRPIPGSQVIAIAGENGMVRTMNSTDGSFVREYAGPVGVRYTAIDASPDGRRLLAAGDDGFLHTWDIVTADLIRIGNQPSWPLIDTRFYGDQFAISASPQEVQIWDLNQERVVSRLIDPDTIPGVFWMNKVGAYPDLDCVLVIAGPEVIIFDIATQSVALRIAEHDRTISDAQISPDKTKLVTISSDDARLRFWSVRTGENIVDYEDENLDGANLVRIAPTAQKFLLGSIRIKVFPTITLYPTLELWEYSEN